MLSGAARRLDLAYRRRTVCLLGGTGFVGRHIAARLVRDGHEVVVPTRYREASRRLLVLPTLRLVEADVHDPLVLRSLFAGCDAVVNLVGILNERGRRDGGGFDAVHARLPELVVAACRDAGVGRLVHMSALQADPAAPSHYLRSKAAGERAVREGAGELLTWTLFRPSVVFGPEDHLFNRFARLLRLFPVLPLARPNARFAPVYVGDVAAAFVRALQMPATGGMTYELCGPHVWSLRELVELTADTLSIRRRILVLPNAVAQMQARLMECLPGKPFSIDNYHTLLVHNLCDPSRPGLKALGIEATAVEAVIGSYLGAANAGSPATASSSRMRETRSA